MFIHYRTTGVVPCYKAITSLRGGVLSAAREAAPIRRDDKSEVL